MKKAKTKKKKKVEPKSGLKKVKKSVKAKKTKKTAKASRARVPKKVIEHEGDKLLDEILPHEEIEDITGEVSEVEVFEEEEKALDDDYGLVRDDMGYGDDDEDSY